MKEFIADQLVNAWEFMTPEQMLNHLSKQIPEVNREKLKELIDTWYNSTKRNKVLNLYSDIIPWIENFI